MVKSANLIATLLYLLIALFSDWHTLASFNTTTQCGCGDPGLFIWFLALDAHNIIHLMNPFYTHFVWAPKGANLLDSTSVLFLGLMLLPITVAFGAISAFNTALMLSLFLNGFCCYISVKKITGHSIFAVVAGLIFELNPFAVQALGFGQLNLGFEAFIPISALLIFEIVQIQAGSNRTSLLLGLTLGIEFFISTEMIVLFLVVLLVVLIVYMLIYNKKALDNLKRSFKRLFRAGLITIAIWAFPLWWALFGPNHLNGPPRPNSWFYGIALPDALSMINQKKYVFNPANGYHGVFTETFVYLGAPLFIVLILGILIGVCYRQHLRPLLFVFTVILAIYWLALGSVIRISEPPSVNDLHNFVLLPWKLINLIPFVKYSAPQRLAPFYWFFVAILASMSLLEIMNLIKRLIKSSLMMSFIIALLAIACIFSLLLYSGLPYKVQKVSTEITDTEISKVIPKDSNVLTIPSVFSVAGTGPMVEQSYSGFTYNLIGAQSVFVPSSYLKYFGGRTSFNALVAFSKGQFINQTQQQLARKALRNMQVNIIILNVDQKYENLDKLTALIVDKVTNSFPKKYKDFWVWKVNPNRL